MERNNELRSCEGCGDWFESPDQDLCDECAGRCKTFVIGCRVSGGVTGTRTSRVKQNGVIRVFDSRQEAQTEADRLMAATNGNAYRTADFKYWVEEI